MLKVRNWISEKKGEPQFNIIVRDALGNILRVLSIADGILYSTESQYTIILQDFPGGDIKVVYKFLKFFEDKKTVIVHTQTFRNDRLIFQKTKTVEMKFLQMNNGARPLEERIKDA